MPITKPVLALYGGSLLACIILLGEVFSDQVLGYETCGVCS